MTYIVSSGALNSTHSLTQFEKWESCPSSPSPLLTAIWDWERCKLPSGVWDGVTAMIEFGGLKTKNNQFSGTVDSIFVRQTCYVLKNYSYSISLSLKRTANKDNDNSQLNQHTCSQRLTFLHNAAMFAWRFTARKLHARPQPDSGRCVKGTEVELCADELVVGGGVGWSYDRRRRRAAHFSSAAAA